MTVSRPTDTSASTVVEAGSTIVTPWRMSRSSMRAWAIAPDAARSARSLTPSVSVASARRGPRWWAAARSSGRTSGRSALALRVVGAVQQGSAARRTRAGVEGEDAGVDLADRECSPVASPRPWPRRRPSPRRVVAQDPPIVAGSSSSIVAIVGGRAARRVSRDMLGDERLGHERTSPDRTTTAPILRNRRGGRLERGRGPVRRRSLTARHDVLREVAVRAAVQRVDDDDPARAGSTAAWIGQWTSARRAGAQSLGRGRARPGSLADGEDHDGGRWSWRRG